MTFTVDVERGSAHVLVSVTGELDLATAPRFRDAGLAALGIEPTTIVVDLSRVTFMDSTGLGVLVLLRRKSRARRSALAVVPSPRAAEVLELAGLGQVFDLRPDVDSALR